MQWVGDARGLLVGAGGVAAAMVTGFWAWLKTRPTKAQDQADLMTGAAAFQQALSAQASAFISTLNQVIERQAQDLAAMSSRIATLEDENEQCRGENRQLHQRVDSLERALIRAGVDLPEPQQTGALVDLNTRSGLLAETPPATPPAQRTKPRRPRRSRKPKE